MKSYLPSKIEPKWQKKWSKNAALYRADAASKKKKYYCLCMFPYPSGDGLHVGHVESYTATDIVSRFKRMRGFNVLYPIGWDAFGLPAENFALKSGVHPAKTTAKNISRYTQQIKSIGLSYDWEREINTSDESYYRFTQWFFLFLYKRGLAYKKKAKVNWCPKCQTTIANEQVVGGKCERCDTEVVQKELSQWFFKTTAYANKLLEGLDNLDWPTSIKETQRNWIGRSEGAEIVFPVKKLTRKDKKYLAENAANHLETVNYLKSLPTVGEIKVFTTRPDTIFGATFLVLAPDGSTIESFKALALNRTKLQAYQLMAERKNELQRTELNKDKTGVVLDGLLAINPATDRPMPLWTADYIMGDYGSGAIMAVPAHDERDFEFAVKNGLEIKKVVCGEEKIIAFLNASFLDHPKKALVSLNKNFNLEPFFLSKKGLVGGSKEKELEEKPYGWAVELEGEAALEKYEKIVRKFLKRDFWSEIIRNKYTVFVFRDGVLKSDVDASKIKIKLEAAAKKLVRRKGFDPRTKNLLRVLGHKNFVPEFVAWTLPIGKIRERICFANYEGTMVNSAFLEGMSVARAKEKTIDWLQQKQLGDKKISFRLRDWLISRQRYWGAPIPIVYCPKCGTVPVPEKDLPVKLPSRVEFVPTGESPLKKLDSFLKVKCPLCGEEAQREADTMDTFVCSSWYYFRYVDPKNSQEFASQEKMRRFLPVDLYVGGAEHAVLHLLYSRFFTKALRDAGFIDFDEPFLKLRNQGMILGPDHNKMSKSKGNVINPDDIVKEWGADSLRMYEMFMGPLEDVKPWDTKGIAGVRRFLDKVWWLREMVVEKEEESQRLATDKNYAESVRLLHFTLDKVTKDIENLCFNTAISQLMILVNQFKNKNASILKKDFILFLKALSPFAPHLVEELWESLGEKDSIFLEDWPTPDPKLIKIEFKELAVQVNGKKRDTIKVSVDTPEVEIRKKVLASALVAKHLAGRPIKKLIYVPGKIVNLVV